VTIAVVDCDRVSARQAKQIGGFSPTENKANKGKAEDVVKPLCQ
jgi:hypothetical protein